MNITQLQAKFSQGINWNAFSYGVYKLLFTILSFALYSHLSTHDFAVWANINSIIFLLLLWLDGGLRKSVPRFSPEFARNKKAHHIFIDRIIFFQIILVIAALPIFWYAAPAVLSLLSLNHNYSIFYLASGIFVAEGIIGILRLIYHAHFWHKQFNSMSTFIIVIEMGIDFFLILSCDRANLLHNIFLVKMTSSIIIVMCGIAMLNKLYNDSTYPGTQIIDEKTLYKAFIKHSGAMWLSSTIKSLSERNFMVPLFTFALGPAAANIYKIANDGALLFHRSVLKTIGSTDTSLLAHLHSDPQLIDEIPALFKTLTKKIATLCFIVLGIFMVIAPYSTRLTPETTAWQLILILTVSHLIEILLSPYERVLEVDRRYLLLLTAYIPYLITVAILMGFQYVGSIGLIGTTALLHASRLAGALLMLMWAKINYHLSFPISYISMLTCALAGFYGCWYLLSHYVPLYFMH